ncbi:hypothetical protein CVT25_003616 [Psilocybe cyanescens]|uniref:Uncharacterized protein n=1 Tax=Psilocybe cyanescens TaxID=93625 RepID=A0A409WPB5_PSICY|nr:hypothetical protein CVT25_003616 [Psilocybe cyanescens]
MTFKPIPRRSHVLPHTVAYLGGANDVLQPTFALLKDNVQIVIEGPPLDPEATTLPSVWDDTTKTDAEYYRYLAIIEDLLSTIEFGATNMAYLIQDSDGEYEIIPEHRRLKQVSCPVWGPLVSMDDVQITVWAEGFDRRRGIWNEKEVDIFYALQDHHRFFLNRAMYGLRHLEGSECDLTFKFYGHLLDRDGSIIGFITEAAWGRNIGLEDEELVAESLERLADAGCIYQSVATNQFLISGGKLRLLQLHSIVPYKDQEKLKRDAEFLHKWALDELLQEFRDYGPYGRYRFLPPRLKANPFDVKYLRMLPIPERPLGRNFIYPDPRFLFKTGVMDLTGLEDDERPFAANTKRRSRRKDLHLIYNRKDRRRMPTDDAIQDRGQLVVSSRTRNRNPNHLHDATSHPYLRRVKVLQELSSTEGTENLLEGIY